MRKFIAIILLSSAVFFISKTVSAQVVNLYPTTIGNRAFGLAGAFTALASDATSGWYNPGALGFVDRTYLNATGNVYGVQRAKVDKYFEVKPLLGTGASMDFEEKSTQATPAAFSLAKKSGNLGTFGFGVYVPRDIGFEDSYALKTFYQDVFGFENRNEIFERSRYAERSVYFGPSFGRQVGSNIALGTSFFMLYHTQSTDMVFDISTIEQETNLNILSHTNIRKENVDFLGLRAAFGLQGRWGNLRLGANIFSPTVRLSERTELTTILAESSSLLPTDRTVIDTDKSTNEHGRGWGFAMGAGWEEAGRWAAGLDLTYYIPEADRDIADRNVLNIQIGGECYLTSHIILRTGFFTDFSSQKSISAPPRDTDPAVNVDIYGGTFQIAYQDTIPGTRVMRSLSVGVRYARGSGDAIGIIYRPDMFEAAAVRRSLSYESIAFMLGGTLAY